MLALHHHFSSVLSTPATLRGLGTALLLLLFVACGAPPDRVEITETRAVSDTRPAPKVGATDAERFSQPSPPSVTPPGVPAPSADMAKIFDWEVPEDWAAAPASSMRIINTTFGPAEGGGECYVTLLLGGGGGVLANINRWRGQVGLDPIDEAELAASEKRPFLNTEAYFLDVSGSFKGVGDSNSQGGYRIVGLIQEKPNITIFVKMVGPAELLEENLSNFRTFCDSIQLKEHAG